MARSLNKVELIGNLTRDPELRYTPQGTGVCTFGLATNRQWTTEGGDKKEDVEFHRIVAWNKLAELCAQLLAKGRKVYVEGRLQTRKWTGQDGQERTTTEVVINDMIILDSRGAVAATGTGEFDVPEDLGGDFSVGDTAQPAPTANAATSTAKPASDSSKKKPAKVEDKTEGGDEDIPF